MPARSRGREGAITKVGVERETFDFLQYATGAKSLIDLQRRLDAFVRPFGFIHACCVEIRAPGGKLVGEELVGHLDPGWHERYFSQEYSRHDAVLRESIQQLDPFFWTDIAKRRRLSPAEKKVLDEVRDFSSYEGFCVPIHNLDGSLSIVSLFGEDQVDRSPDTLTALHVVGLAYGGAARRLKYKDGAAAMAPRLTPRQAEIVSYLAGGYTTDEVADLMSLSVETVRFHIKEAKRRYGATTLPHLISLSLQNREFVP